MSWGFFYFPEQMSVFIGTIAIHSLKKVTMKFKSSLLIASIMMVGTSSAMANGEAIYKQVCMACHGAGVAGAPKVGDKAKWAPLIKEGQATLTAHGYVGVRGMPPKGGKPDLTLEKFSEAVVYMANQSGGSWKTPDEKLMHAIHEEVEKRKKQLAKK
jgi:cytochrome c5